MFKKNKLGMENVKNVVLVSSGKGGVGKSTTAANIAASLSLLGNRVGMLDADIYGPSQFMMFGLEDGSHITVSENGTWVEPFLSHDIKITSIASRVKQGQALSWRGPMAAMVLQQMLFETNWGDLDYLIVDMPPGTGDIQISMCEKLPEAKVVIVTTPQDVALIDCKKGIDVYRSKNIEILGIVENMSVHICSNCGNVDHIFGEDGAKKLEEEYGARVLGRIPLNTTIRIDSDSGTPITLKDPKGPIGSVYETIANEIMKECRVDVEPSDGEVDPC
jgi:ATP-binding protein involved in chromosome partitioning